MQVISVLMCGCLSVCGWYGISVWFIYNRTKLTFCKCQSLSHIPNTSLWCSNQPLHYGSWTLKLKGKLKTMIIKKNFIALFYGWGSTASRLQPLWGGSLPFTIQFPENPGTHFIDLGRIKCYRTSGLGIQCLNC